MCVLTLLTGLTSLSLSPVEGVSGGPEFVRVDPDDTRLCPSFECVQAVWSSGPLVQSVCPEVVFALATSLSLTLFGWSSVAISFLLIPKGLLWAECVARRALLCLVPPSVSFLLLGDGGSDEGAELYDFAQVLAKGLLPPRLSRLLLPGCQESWLSDGL